MSRPARLPSAFTLFTKLLALRDRIAGLFRAPRTDSQRARLNLELAEERVVPEGRPWPYPVAFMGHGSSSALSAYDLDTGALRWSVNAYGSSFDGGVRAAAGDFTGDGIPDALVGPGPEHSPRLKILDGVDGTLTDGPLASFLAFGSNVTGGVFVAAGDVNGDGRADVIAAAQTNAGPRIKAFDPIDGSVLANFLVSGSAFESGITIAAADFTGDGRVEVVAGAGANGRVKIYNPLTGETIDGPLGSFRAFGSSYEGGVFVNADSLAGDVSGDGIPDLVVGMDAGSITRVKVWSGADGSVLYDFQPFGSSFTGGARPALAFADDDDRADIIVGSGPGITAQVLVFGGADGVQLASPLGTYTPFGSGFTGGVFVGASNDPMSPMVSWDVAPLGTVAGQAYQVVVRVTGMMPPAPTGTVTLTATVTGGGPTYTLGTGTLTGAGGNAATATIAYGTPALGGGLPAGSYYFQATYNGDSNYLSASTGTPATVSASPVPALAAGGAGADLVGDPAGAGQARGGYSVTGLNYSTGSVTVGHTALGSSALGDWWGVNWSWTSATASGYTDGVSGSHAMQSEFAHVVQVNGNNSIALVSNAASARFFDLYGGSYHTRYGSTAGLSHDTGNGVFVVTDGTGRKLTFYDFSGGTPTGRTGKLKKITDVDGQITEVTSWDGSGKPTEVQRTTGSGGSALTESFVYAYISSGTNAGLLSSVTQRTKIGTGSWVTTRSVDHTYYDGTTGPGLAGALKFATVKDSGGTAIDTWYYRYYTSGTGSSGNIKYAFGPASYARLVGALGTGVDSLTDGQVDDYADKYIVYNSSGQATTIVDAAAGCSVCSGGQGTFTYTYSTNSSAGLSRANEWAKKVVETFPDSSTNTVYSNGIGGVMLAARSDGTSTWRSFTRYDDTGRPILSAGPTTVTGLSESNLDLVGYSAGNASYLSDSVGLVAAYTYAGTTTATSSTAGNAAGYLQSVDIKQGETGTAVPQSALTYYKNTASSIDFFNLAANTVYRNTNGTGGQTTSFAYTFASGTNQIASTTVTLPTVTTAQNGSNSANSMVSVTDSFGRMVWSKDAGGLINYVAYDDLTGAVTKTIVDVDTTQTGTFSNLPSGWSTPSGAGLHLTTTFEVDALGRTTKMTAPNGRIDYTVYDDVNQSVRFYAGWNTGTNTPTGPTVVSRFDRAGGYSETLTMSATPSTSSNRPTGTESIAQVQSLSRSYKNEAGQVTHTDAYFSLSGLTYSTSTSLGTSGVNFYRTLYQYDNTGATKRVETPEGTITRIVRDGVGRVTSEWIGTDDTPTSGNWSPTNLTGTNTVKVREYEYDGGSVGDSNLTKVTEYPGGGAAARVTQSWFDWRNRAVAVKSGVETSESTSVNRPLAYYDFDNLGQITQTRVYDADTATPSVTSGVPQPLSSSLLRAQSAASFDELGRAYRTDTYSVDPSSGSVGSYTLYSLAWFDARGNVLKTLSPGGLVQKVTTDGAGRITASYVTDGGGDSGYSDADDVTGDTVLSQTEYTYDASGNVLTTTTRERFHDASGTGALGSPSSGIGARVSYAGFYYDLADRLTASVDVGTNGASSWTRPGSAPSSSSTVLVTSSRYATDAVQTVTLTGSPTGGTFTLSFGGYTTGSIAYNASASTVDSALEALTSIGSGNVVVSAAPGGSGWEVRFAGTLADKYQAAVTGSGAGLTGGTSPAVSIATVNAGGDAGRAAEVTDPAGREHRTYSDALGRSVRSVQNFVDGVISDGDDKTVGYAYSGAGMISLSAYLSGGGVQETRWLFNVNQAGGSAIDSKDIVGTVQWPDETLGLASSGQQETLTVNALGQTVTMSDRNGNVHALTYDVLGRVVSDAVTTLGSGVDGAVRRIETAYDGQGNAYLVTSYNAASGGSVVNQVQRAFNGLGQLITEWQSHSGSVNTSTSPKVQYTRSEMPSGANHSRLTSIVYPNGRTITYDYGTSSALNDLISRLNAIKDGSTTLEGYSYLGAETVVVRSHPQPGVDLTYVKRSGESNGDAGDQYIGLDRFGRVADQRWAVASSGTARDRFQYTYDAASNRTARTNVVNTSFNEAYTYDGLDQLASFSRGSHTLSWDYDAVGNFDSVTTDGGSPVTRSANRQNEITSISGATTPTYDGNGNMTGDEVGRTLVYDAWNRLVAVKSGSTVLVSYQYDGENRRVVRNDGTARDLYYSKDWQVVEERVSGSADLQYVWSAVYVDALIARDRDTDANGSLDERLYVVQDGNWNVTALLDTSGVVVERFVYDPYGVASVLNASWSSLSSSAYSWAYGFQGLRYDSIARANAAHERWYSPTIGVWYTMDPIRYEAGDVVLYRAMSNNTIRYIDPEGTGVRDWWFRNGIGNRIEGGIRLVGGASMAVAGVGVATGGTILGVGVGGVVAIPVGGTIAIVGADQAVAGLRSVLDGQEHQSFIAQGINGIAGSGGASFDTVAQFITLWQGVSTSGAFVLKNFGGTLEKIGKIPVLGWIFRGSEGDAAWYQLSYRQRYLSEVSKSAVPTPVHKSIQGLDAAKQAELIISQLGFWGRLNPLNAIREGLLGTGASPGVRWIVIQMLASGYSIGDILFSDVPLDIWLGGR